MLFLNNLFFFKKSSKIIYTSNTGYEETTKLIVDEFMKLNFFNSLKRKKIFFTITDDVSKKIRETSSHPDEKDLDMVFNGYVVYPDDYSCTEFNVILNKNVFNTNWYYSTIYHELTHVVDFTRYSDFYGNGYIKNKESRIESFYYEFYCWTEFKAKRNGLIRLQKELDKTKETLNLKSARENFIIDINKSISPLNKRYHLMHFLAHLACYENVDHIGNEEIYPSEFIKNNFGHYHKEIYFILLDTIDFKKFERNKYLLKKYIFNQ